MNLGEVGSEVGKYGCLGMAVKVYLHESIPSLCPFFFNKYEQRLPYFNHILQTIVIFITQIVESSRLKDVKDSGLEMNLGEIDNDVGKC